MTEISRNETNSQRAMSARCDGWKRQMRSGHGFAVLAV
jgi:hypothetical protein